MGLTNTQYDSIIRKYDETQMNNRRILDERKEYVYSHVEGFKELEESVITVSLDSTFFSIEYSALSTSDES